MLNDKKKDNDVDTVETETDVEPQADDSSKSKGNSAEPTVTAPSFRTPEEQRRHLQQRLMNFKRHLKRRNILVIAGIIVIILVIGAIVTVVTWSREITPPDEVLSDFNRSLTEEKFESSAQYLTAKSAKLIGLPPQASTESQTILLQILSRVKLTAKAEPIYAEDGETARLPTEITYVDTVTLLEQMVEEIESGSLVITSPNKAFSDEKHALEIMRWLSKRLDRDDVPMIASQQEMLFQKVRKNNLQNKWLLQIDEPLLRLMLGNIRDVLMDTLSANPLLFVSPSPPTPTPTETTPASTADPEATEPDPDSTTTEDPDPGTTEPQASTEPPVTEPPTTEPASFPYTYTVQSGDTVYTIAKRAYPGRTDYKRLANLIISANNIKEANPGTGDYMIVVGMVLTIPSPDN